MSKFVHLWPHILDYTFPSLCHLILIYFCLSCLLLFCSCHVAQLSGLWTWDQVRQNTGRVPCPIMPSFIYCPLRANQDPNPSRCPFGSLIWFIVEWSVMLKATLVCTQHSCLIYTWPTDVTSKISLRRHLYLNRALYRNISPVMYKHICNPSIFIDFYYHTWTLQLNDHLWCFK